MSSRSIVEYLSERDGYNCGYCKSENTCYSQGMWAHVLTPEDYQNLIDRGWRRSGEYCYKPIMNRTCCPQYAIRCEAKRFILSKSQKKILKKVNKFLNQGRNQKGSPTPSDETDDNTMEISESGQIADIQRLKNISNIKNIAKNEIIPDLLDLDDIKSKTSNSEVVSETAPSSFNSSDIVNNSSSQSQLSITASSSSKNKCNLDPNRPPCRKAKDIRRERRLQKLLAAGKTPEEISAVETKNTSQPKTIEDYLSLSSSPEQRHKLELRLVSSDIENPQFSRTFEESYTVYQKYQMHIHKDPAEKCLKGQYTRFLVNSPFQNSDGKTYGSFHQQYWLDNKLIAVAVMDILPFCVSSVYFYYDPDYSFLSLGTYAALREIAFTRELNKSHPILQYYYMGFYIHSCVKMRYKGQFHPSYLLCPETYIFQKIEKCKPKLDVSKYHRLEEDPDKGDIDGVVDLKEVAILYDRRSMNYPIYRYLNADANDEVCVRQYAGFVGKKCYKKMLLYRS